MRPEQNAQIFQSSALSDRDLHLTLPRIHDRIQGLHGIRGEHVVGCDNADGLSVFETHLEGLHVVE